MEDQRNFSRGEDYFANAVTELYKDDPVFRDIYPYEVLDLLAEKDCQAFELPLVAWRRGSWRIPNYRC